MKMLFFTGANCMACVTAKKWADAHDIHGYKVCDLGERENAMLAAKFHVQGCPTLLVVDSKGQPQRSFHGSSCFSAWQKWRGE
jgi:hypothetical protein